MVSKKAISMSSIDNNQEEKHYERLVRRAYAVVLTERVIPKSIPPLCAVGSFVSASWLGLWVHVWSHISPAYQPAVLGVLAVGALASSFLVKGDFLTKRADAVQRLDDNLGEKSQPARMIDSHVSNSTDSVEGALWNVHRQGLLQKWNKHFSVGYPRVHITKPMKIATALSAILLVGSAAYAGENRTSYLKQAFNFQAPKVIVPPPVIRAWISPPKGIEKKKQYISNQGGEEQRTQTNWIAHQNSTLHVIISGTKSDIHLNDKKLLPEKTLVDEEDKNKVTYEYKPIVLNAGEHKIRFSHGPVWTFSIPKDLPPKISLKGVGTPENQPNALSFECLASDDEGVKKGMVDLSPLGDNKKIPLLPSARLPKITVPGSRFCQ